MGIKTPSSAPETYSPIPLQSQGAVPSSTKFTPSKVAPVKLKAHAQRRGGSRIEAELLGCQPISPPSTTLPHTPLSSGGISGCKYTLASTLVTLPHPKSTKKSPPLIPAYKVNDKPRILSNHPKLASSYQSKTTSSCQQDGSPFHVRSSHVITREIENKPAAIRSGHIISKSPHQNRSNFIAPSPGQRPAAEESLQPTIEPITLMNDGRSLARDSLDFGTLRLGDVLTMQLRVCNAAHRPVQVQFITTGPFSLPTQQLSIQPRSFVPIPIAFHPNTGGYFPRSADCS
ncbi:hypothetical protein BASA62_009661 [Batrachochytrium salamandrivorans]|nr:hypothetical protein BASA62_009661 [Batrachochytrium salamandrivorans]